MKTSSHADAFSALVKTSSWYKDPAVVAAVAAPVAGIAADAAYSGIKNLIGAQQKSRAFKSMLSENPHLKNQDARDTQRYFNTLWSTNPEMAKDPIVAGAFVHQQHGSGDESFPHRGILAGASDMAKMRADLIRGHRPSQVGSRTEQAVGRFIGAMGQARERDLEEREKMFDRQVSKTIRGLEQRERAVGMAEKKDRAHGFDPAQILREAAGARGSSFSPEETAPSRRGGRRRRIVPGGRSGSTHREREKESSASSLRALLGV